MKRNTDTFKKGLPLIISYKKLIENKITLAKHLIHSSKFCIYIQIRLEILHRYPEKDHPPPEALEVSVDT